MSRDEFDEQAHRFAACSASRAAGRGVAGFTTEKVRRAVEESGLAGLVSGPAEKWPKSAAAFDRLHRKSCAQILSSLHADGVPGAGCGHAAKIVAIYLKTRVVCGGSSDTTLGKLAHPPIDRLLLQSLAASE